MQICLSLMALSLTVAFTCSASWASTPSQKLMPLEARALGETGNGNDFGGIEAQINRNLRSSQEGEDNLLDALNIPLVDQLLDDDGQVTLPLGVTVFGSMGDPSVGFGADL